MSKQDEDVKGQIFQKWKISKNERKQQQNYRANHTKQLINEQKRLLKRRDSIGDRIEQSIEDHIALSGQGDNFVGGNNDAGEAKELFQKLKTPNILQLSKVIIVINFFKNNKMITVQEHAVLKTKIIQEYNQGDDSILCAAVELLQLDQDMDECLDTFEKVLQTINKCL